MFKILCGDDKHVKNGRFSQRLAAVQKLRYLQAMTLFRQVLGCVSPLLLCCLDRMFDQDVTR